MKMQGSKMNIKIIVTSFTALLFIVVGVTGVLMFFHLLDEYTKVTHDILAITFLLFSACHVIINWKILKRYFKKPTFLVAGAFVFIITLLLVNISKNSGDIQRELVDKLLKSPVSCSFAVLNNDYNQTKVKIESNGIVIGGARTIEEICKKNQISPHDLIELIMK
jgi:hypothetical protein